MVGVNVELLDRVLDHIRMNPEQHDQRYWAQQEGCNTSYCFAGWTVILEGGKAVEYVHKPDLSVAGVDGFCDSDGERIYDVAEWAAFRLGLGFRTASDLFDGYNTFEDIERIVKDLKNNV